MALAFSRIEYIPPGREGNDSEHLLVVVRLIDRNMERTGKCLWIGGLGKGHTQVKSAVEEAASTCFELRTPPPESHEAWAKMCVAAADEERARKARDVTGSKNRYRSLRASLDRAGFSTAIVEDAQTHQEVDGRWVATVVIHHFGRCLIGTCRNDSSYKRALRAAVDNLR